MLDNLLTVPETAVFTRLKESTIRRWILEKRIPYVKLGRRVFVVQADIESLIAESLVPARKRSPCAVPVGKGATHAA